MSSIKKHMSFFFVKGRLLDIAIFSIICISIFLRLIWFVILLLLIVLIYKITSRLLNFIKNKCIAKILRLSFAFVFILIVSSSMKLFFIDIYKVPSTSMEDTLYTGDIIILNKIAYGPKLPRNAYDIPLINILFYLYDHRLESINDEWWPYLRMSGISEIKKGDIVVFQMSKKFSLVKRCIAISGDTLSITKGKIYVNNIEYNDPKSVKNKYILKVKGQGNIYKYANGLNLRTDLNKNGDSFNYFEGNLSKSQKLKILKLPEIMSIEKYQDTFTKNKNLFFRNDNLSWTMDKMGPFVIPKRNMTISLNMYNYQLCVLLFLYFEFLGAAWVFF